MDITQLVVLSVSFGAFEKNIVYIKTSKLKDARLFLFT
ncbi:hypothetical protein DSM04_11163 [Leeuwenhoekiella aestuarii]|uniref:Uncharacterized protein n=1 Tax=Leeuwenhoekiella aestuarii TaxID=2249426 RepID=A0A4Q0NNM2_9FLAO|nr:hypothetical protein DSM04_11163 [Leeuwenhoekiella aestuarii]